MSRPGLLVVNSSRSWGGNEHWAVRIARGMAERGHPVRFAWCHDVIGERVRAAGLEGSRVRLGGDLDPRGVLALRREMVGLQAGAVLLTRWREYLQGGLAARLAMLPAGRPRVVMGLGLLIDPRADLKRHLTFRLTDRVLVNAPEIRDRLAALPWIDAAKIEVVVNGLDLADWPPRWEDRTRGEGAAFRREHGIPADAPLAVNIGNLTRQKDQASLIAACARLRDKVPGLRVMVLGEGALRDGLQTDIDRRGLADTVALPGFVTDVKAALAAADLFVLSSRNEGMAWVLMEAAACGLPVVTTDVSGARYCVEDGASGLVVPPENPAALAEAMAALLTDPDRRREMGRKARRLAEIRFDAERMVDQTARILFA